MLATEKQHPRRTQLILLLAVIPLILIAGYGLNWAISYFVPAETGSTANHLIIICTVIAVLLCMPYFILKTGFHAARLTDAEEEELKLEDIPKEERRVLDINQSKRVP